MFPDIHFNLLGHEINIFTYSLFMAVGFLVFFYELEKHVKKDTFFENEVENIRLVVTFTFIFGFICVMIQTASRKQWNLVLLQINGLVAWTLHLINGTYG